MQIFLNPNFCPFSLLIYNKEADKNFSYSETLCKIARSPAKAGSLRDVAQCAAVPASCTMPLASLATSHNCQLCDASLNFSSPKANAFVLKKLRIAAAHYMKCMFYFWAIAQL